MDQKIKDSDIETFLWRGQMRYKCPLHWESGTRCEFNTFSLDELRKHMAQGNHQVLVIPDPNSAMPRISNTSQSDAIPPVAEAHTAPGRIAPEFVDLQFSENKSEE